MPVVLQRALCISRACWQNTIRRRSSRYPQSRGHTQSANTTEPSCQPRLRPNQKYERKIHMRVCKERGDKIDISRSLVDFRGSLDTTENVNIKLTTLLTDIADSILVYMGEAPSPRATIIQTTSYHRACRFGTVHVLSRAGITVYAAD